MKQALGFTIVELVVVLVLLGILSGTAMSRFVEPTAFAPRNLSAAIRAQAHYAGQLALSGHSNIILQISRQPGQWQIEVLESGSTVAQLTPDLDNTQTYVTNSGSTYELLPASPFSIAFDTRGDVSAGVVGAVGLDVNAGTELQIIGDSSQWLCIYPTGYVSARVCE